jgi:phosphoglycolate phosphatase-like HAD superfamily hydrolase
VAVLAGAGTASCTPAEPDHAVFDRVAYCEAMHASEPAIDVEAMAAGDPAAYETAGATYEQLAQLAPPELAYEWRVIISGMDGMIREAQGEDTATDEETAEFRTAYQTVYSDYLDQCVEADRPVTGEPSVPEHPSPSR